MTERSTGATGFTNGVPTGQGPASQVMEDLMMRREMNILAMAKGKERFVFLYDDRSYDALIDVLERYAGNPDLNFSSADATLLGQKALECRSRITGLGFRGPKNSDRCREHSDD